MATPPCQSAPPDLASYAAGNANGCRPISWASPCLSGSSALTAGGVGHRLDLDEQVRMRERGDRDGGARRSLVAEEFAVHRVVGREVGHVGEEGAHLDDIGERSASAREDVADVLEHRARLDTDIEQWPSARIERRAGDGIIGPARAGSGDEDEVP